MAKRQRGDNQNAGEQRPSDRKGGQGGERPQETDRDNDRPSRGQAGHGSQMDQRSQVDQRNSAVDRKPGDAGRQADGAAGARDLAGEDRTRRSGNRADEPAEESSRLRSSDEDRG
jgi:hypothetical protein